MDPTRNLETDEETWEETWRNLRNLGHKKPGETWGETWGLEAVKNLIPEMLLV